MTMNIEINSSPRLRVRAVTDIEHKVANTITVAKERNEVTVRVYHGGGVANSYGYPAETEGLVVVALPDGRHFARVRRVPANKVTKAGVVRRCLGRDTAWAVFFDDRYSAETWALARPHAHREAEALCGPPR